MSAKSFKSKTNTDTKARTSSSLGTSLKQKLSGYVHDGLFWGTALLLTGFVASTPAFSQKINFDQAGGWSVSKISADANSASEPYCVMAKRFDNNVILSVAKNSQNQKSLAVDFQSSHLSPDREYQVVLKAGDNVARGFEVTPVTDKAFVIRLGEDQVFSNALNSGEELRVSFGGEELSFDTSSFKEGSSRINDCLSQTQTMSAEADTNVQTATVNKVAYSMDGPRRLSVDDVKGIKPASGQGAGSGSHGNLIQELKSRIASLEAQNREKEIALQAQAQQKSNLQDKVRGLKSENKNMAQRLANQNNNVSETEQMKENLAALKSDYENKMASLTQENSKLERQLREFSADKQEFTSLKRENSNLIRENRELKQRLAKAESYGLNAQTQNNRVLDLKRLVSGLRNQISTLKDEKMELQNIVASDSSGIIPAAGSKAGSEHCLSSSNWNLEKATRRYQEAQREIDRLGNALREQKQECRKEIQSVERQLFSPEITSQAQNERFIEMRERLIETSEQLKKQRVLAKRRIRALQNELEQANKENLTLAKPYRAERREVEPQDRARTRSYGSAPTSLSSQNTQNSSRRTRGNNFVSLLSEPVNEASLANLLLKVDVGINGQIFNIPSPAESGKSSFRWDTGNLLGAADVYKLMSMSGSFNEEISDYLSRSRKYCDGEFESKQLRSYESASSGVMTKLHSINCRDNGKSIKKLILFVDKPNEFVVISHEGSSDDKRSINNLQNELEQALSVPPPIS